MQEQEEEAEAKAAEEEVQVVELQVVQVYEEEEEEEEEEVEVQEEHLWKEEVEADDDLGDFVLFSTTSGLEQKLKIIKSSEIPD